MGVSVRRRLPVVVLGTVVFSLTGALPAQAAGTWEVVPSPPFWGVGYNTHGAVIERVTG